MSEERKLQFRGGIGMSVIPVVIYVFFCMVLFIGFKAFNMEALAVGGFLSLLIGGVFCTSYSECDPGNFLDHVGIGRCDPAARRHVQRPDQAVRSFRRICMDRQRGRHERRDLRCIYIPCHMYCIDSDRFLDRNHVYRVPDLLPGGDHAGCQRDDDGRQHRIRRDLWR
mgnify:CR=1 FL=1